jgi:hypothetical protein
MDDLRITADSIDAARTLNGRVSRDRLRAAAQAIAGPVVAEELHRLAALAVVCDTTDDVIRILMDRAGELRRA